MGYEKYYQDGWKSGEEGGTPITPEALNHMENGIETANKNLLPEPQEANNATFLRNDNTWQQVTPENIGAVPTSRTVNGRALSGNITLSASDVSAVPTTRTVNNKALSANITLSASDVGARPSTWTPTAADVGAVSKSGDTMTGELKLKNGISVVGDAEWNAYTFKETDGTVRGSMMVSNTNALHFNVPASDSTHSDRYILGRPSTGLTGDRWFDVLTSKSAVTVAQGGTGATSAANARKNLGLANFHAIETSSTAWKSNLNILKDCFSSITNVQSVVITHNNAGARVTCFGCKYDNYGYFIVANINGVYLYKNHNGTWSEKTIATW